MNADLSPIQRLMTYATGDEKHDSSTHSTLDVLWVLYDRILHYDSANPTSEDRDSFVLSKGHGPLALYAVLAAKGFFPVDTLKTFAAWDSILGLHPDHTKVPGIEVSTGSLGHGLPMAIGISLALRMKHNVRRVYVLIGDGECNEGSIWESILLAGNLHLSQLTCIVINNHSSSMNLGNLATKFTAFGWNTTTINGHSHDDIYNALRRTDTTRPTAVIAEMVEEI